MLLMEVLRNHNFIIPRPRRKNKREIPEMQGIMWSQYICRLFDFLRVKSVFPKLRFFQQVLRRGFFLGACLKQGNGLRQDEYEQGDRGGEQHDGQERIREMLFHGSRSFPLRGEGDLQDCRIKVISQLTTNTPAILPGCLNPSKKVGS